MEAKRPAADYLKNMDDNIDEDGLLVLEAHHSSHSDPWNPSAPFGTVPASHTLLSHPSLADRAGQSLLCGA